MFPKHMPQEHSSNMLFLVPNLCPASFKLFFLGGGGRLDRCWTRGWTCRAKCEQNIMKTNMFHEIHSQKPLNDDLKTHMLVEHHKKSNTIKSHVLAINRIRIS